MGEIKSTQEVICIKSDAFFHLVDTLVKYIKENHGATESKWIDTEECLKLLKISSRTTLGVLRDMGKIAYSTPRPKIFVYDRDSVLAYLESQKKSTF